MNEADATLAPLFQGLSDGICVSDAEGKLLYLNPAAERLLSVTADAALGSTACKLLCGRLTTATASECASTCPLRGLRGAQQAVTFTGRLDQKSCYRWLETGIQRLENGACLRVRCERMPGAGPDGAARERHLTIIEDASAELELEQRKEEWRRMLAHDLRAPLTNVFGVLSLICDGAVDPVPELPDRALLDGSVRSCQRMMELIDLYLDSAKLDAGAMPVDLAALPLAPLVRRCVEEQSFAARERRVEVSVDVAPELRARADARLLPRAVQNVLHNALKFSPEGGRVEIRASAPAPDWVELSVSDSGPGIAAEELPGLFEPFRQAEAGRRSARPGTGLGLAFCRRALAAMGGRVSVVSSPGAGSVFTLHLRR